MPDEIVAIVVFHDDFDPEFMELPPDVQDELLAKLELLKQRGWQLGRPHADTLAGSRYPRMKELIVNVADDWWRFAYAFDPRRQAVVLCGGAKGGGSQEKFYRSLIARADRRFAQWLKEL